jgi:hypothetical protein
MAAEAELALVGTVATVCIFVIPFWLGHIDRLWGRFEQEKRLLAEGATFPRPGFFTELGGIAQQSQLAIAFGGGVILACFVWLVAVVVQVPALPLPGSVIIGVAGFVFALLAFRVWWREFAFFRQAMGFEAGNLSQQIAEVESMSTAAREASEKSS